MLIAELFTIVKIQKQLNCPPKDDQIKKLWNTHTHTHAEKQLTSGVDCFHSRCQIKTSYFKHEIFSSLSFLWASQVDLVGKNPLPNAGDARDQSQIPELGRYPGGRNGIPFQYSCWENLMDRGNLWATRKITPSLYLPGPLPMEVIFQGAGSVIKNPNLFTLFVTPVLPSFLLFPMSLQITINSPQEPLAEFNFYGQSIQCFAFTLLRV